MIYIALLRGINVGGKARVEMARLRQMLESLGSERVATYINSGNVIFSDERGKVELHTLIETALAQEFGFPIKLVLIDRPTLYAIADALPDSWQNDDLAKCDVLFLGDMVNNEQILTQLPLRSGIDNVKYVDGAILWCVERKNISRSGLLKIIGTDLYRQLTIRNCNTLRKLCILADAAGEKR
jgi:uncharacterized protein (DUF1697 family)